MIRRRRTWIFWFSLLLGAGLVGSGCTPAPYRKHPQFDSLCKDLKTYGLVKPRVEVCEISAGGVAELRDDWCAAAQGNVVAALERQFSFKLINLKTKKLEPSMLPQEAAEVIADNISANPSITGFTVLENAPTTIATHPGFKLLYQYKNKDGLQCKGMYCGFLSGDWFYALQYTAPTRYYFDKDVGTFEKVLNSFTFIKTT